MTIVNTIYYEPNTKEANYYFPQYTRKARKVPAKKEKSRKKYLEKPLRDYKTLINLVLSNLPGIVCPL